ncbi:3-oxoacyl-ACP reductase [Streptomyces xinghaiensis]|uniref:3-oxoacyl-ACP reductase n=1 Tax=Streptomyces xinghaiensis TaxID=1038928 RepID=UPI0002E29282|nr:3-oxoacyl-ACP reductase [Streptomyces xinghaiensis]MZE78226.1 SDR family oxidoreductase [Streptomyces sp. SID5475]
MADRYLRFTGTAPGRFLTRRLGLPRPAPLHRWSPERPSLDGPLLRLTVAAPCPGLAGVLNRTGLPVRTEHRDDDGTAGTGHRGSAPYAAVVVDATGVDGPDALHEVHAALHPVVRSVATGGRIVVLGTAPDPADHHRAAAQQALEGFVRSLGKEIGKGCTVNLLRLDPGAAGTAALGAAAAAAESTLHFLLSPKSAYVSGQPITVRADAVGAEGADGADGADGPEGAQPAGAGGPSDSASDAASAAAATDRTRPLAGTTALVTGCARGIGEAVAETLARDGARVVCLDIPSADSELTALAGRLGGTALPLDITAPEAADRIAAAVPGGLDILVHNAGITRDRRLANMAADRWDQVIDVNLGSVLRVTDRLLKAGALRRGTGRIIATASIAGIAGNAGQTNYAASKAGIIGFTRSLAPRAAAEYGVTVNAVAPGFIETKMTAAVPLLIREAGRRMNSLAQGGLPVDVAETTAWLAQPASGGVNGQTVRVCGQSLLGA